jgi:hypothetical protein
LSGCVAVRAELIRHLLGRDGVDSRLNLTCRHARVENEHVRPEALWWGFRGSGRRGEDERRGEGEQTGQEPNSA